MNLSGKTVVITGAARGIGLEVARQMVHAGARVLMSDIDESAVLAAAAALCDGTRSATGLRCDVTSADDVAALVHRTTDEFGPPDLIINNAAAMSLGPGNIDSPDLDHWHTSYDVNVLGSVRVIRTFLPTMSRRGSGYIVNTCSSLVIRPNAVVQHLLPYFSSKGAILTFTYALAYAMKSRGIKVSLFCPGLTRTTDDAPAVTDNGWMEDVRSDLTVPGSVTECAAILLAGIKRESFLISSEPDFENAIRRLAANNLDPLSDFQ